MKCECKHMVHFEDEVLPNSHDHHVYMGVEATEKVFTTFGTYQMCAPCAASYKLAHKNDPRTGGTR